jgi:hypothetical protein
VPEFLHQRPISSRAFDTAHQMIDADLADGDGVEAMIVRLLEDPEASYLHLHNAKPGCYMARVTRA